MPLRGRRIGGGRRRIGVGARRHGFGMHGRNRVGFGRTGFGKRRHGRRRYHARSYRPPRILTPKEILESFVNLHEEYGIELASVSMFDNIITNLPVEEKTYSGQENIQIFTALEGGNLMLSAGGQLKGTVNLNVFDNSFPAYRLTVSVIGLEDAGEGWAATNLAEILNMSFTL